MKAGVVTPGQKDSARVIEMAVSVPRTGRGSGKNIGGRYRWHGYRNQPGTLW